MSKIYILTGLGFGLRTHRYRCVVGKDALSFAHDLGCLKNLHAPSTFLRVKNHHTCTQYTPPQDGCSEESESLAATMPTLPEELLALIFEQLASPDTFEVANALSDLQCGHDGARMEMDLIHTHSERIQTLRNLCLASKTMHRLAWPVLYRDFCNRRLNEFDESELLPDYEGPTKKLLRTICLTPHYGLALQNLLIHQWTPIEAMHGEQLFELLQSDATISALFQWRARGFCFYEESFVDSLHRALSLGFEDGLVTLLLLLCPNIRELELAPHIDFDRSLLVDLLGTLHYKSRTEEPLPEIEPDFEQEESDYIIAQMFGRPWPDQKLQKPLVLQSLRRLTLWDPGLANLSVTCIAQILTLPSLLTFETHGVNYRDSPKVLYEALDWSGQKSKMRSLELHECQASSDNLSEILKFCPQLERLVIAWDDYDATMSVLDPDDKLCLEYGNIAKTIAKHNPHLKSLELDGSRGWENVGAQPKHPFIIGDKLHAMDHLERLILDPHAIYGSEYGTFGSGLGASVPKSVTYLVLTAGAWDSGLDGIDHYHAWQKKDWVAFLQDPTFDRLSTVQLNGRYKFSTEDQAAAEQQGWKMSPRGPNENLVRLVHSSRPRTKSAHSTTQTT
jgi:hypothetical protein